MIFDSNILDLCKNINVDNIGNILEDIRRALLLPTTFVMQPLLDFIKQFAKAILKTKIKNVDVGINSILIFLLIVVLVNRRLISRCLHNAWFGTILFFNNLLMGLYQNCCGFMGKTNIHLYNNVNTNQKDIEVLPSATCILCCDNPRSVVLLPCRHLCICRECHAKFRQLLIYFCPVCRSRIDHFYNVYL